MIKKVLTLTMFLVVFLVGNVCAQCVTRSTDKDVYAYGEDVTASMYSDTCYFAMLYGLVFDAGGNLVISLEPHLISQWPQQVDYYWDQTDSQGQQVQPGTYRFFRPEDGVTFTVLGFGKMYALSLRPTGSPPAESWKIAELVKIDLSTGTGTKIGATDAGLDQRQWSLDLSFDPQGTLWAVNGVSRWNNLVTIDTDTGAGTVAGSTGTLIEGIAFDADGILYAADSGYNNWDSNGDKLVKIDTNDFSYTVVGPTGWDIDGLALAPDGTLYGVDSGILLEVNKNTGVVTPIGSSGSSGLYAITFTPDGIMYGCDSNGDIYTIDPDTGVVSYVCSTGFPYMVGLAFAPLMPDDIGDYIRGLPDECLKNNAGQRKDVLYNKLVQVQSLIDAGDYQEAIDKLIHDIRPKMDGEGKNDWITCPDARDKLIAMIDALTAYLQGLI